MQVTPDIKRPIADKIRATIWRQICKAFIGCREETSYQASRLDEALNDMEIRAGRLIDVAYNELVHFMNTEAKGLPIDTYLMKREEKISETTEKLAEKLLLLFFLA